MLCLFSPGCVSLSPSCAAAPPAGLSPASAELDSSLPVSCLPVAAPADQPAAPAEPGRETPAEPATHPDLECCLHQTPAVRGEQETDKHGNTERIGVKKEAKKTLISNSDCNYQPETSDFSMCGISVFSDVTKLQFGVTLCQDGGQTCSCCSWLRLASSLREHSILFCSSITRYRSAACSHTNTHMHKHKHYSNTKLCFLCVFSLLKLMCSSFFFLSKSITSCLFLFSACAHFSVFLYQCIPLSIYNTTMCMYPSRSTSASLEFTVSVMFWMFRSCRWASSWAERSSNSMSPRRSCSFYTQTQTDTQ